MNCVVCPLTVTDINRFSAMPGPKIRLTPVAR